MCGSKEKVCRMRLGWRNNVARTPPLNAQLHYFITWILKCPTLINFGSFFSTTISTTQAGTVSLRRTPSVSPPASRASNLIQNTFPVNQNNFLFSLFFLLHTFVHSLLLRTKKQINSKYLISKILPVKSSAANFTKDDRRVTWNLEIFVPVPSSRSVPTLFAKNYEFIVSKCFLNAH